MDLWITNLLGIIGFVILIIALIFNSGRNTKKRIILYYTLQLIGAGLLGAYAYFTNSQIFLVLEIVWVLVAIYFLYKNITELKKNKVEIKKVKK